MSARIFSAIAALSVLVCGKAAAQLIPIKTVPVAEGDQFGFFPSSNLGMAGVSIALTDTLLDPFNNPAKAALLRGARFFGSPSFYSVSSNAGSGRTLPLGGLARRGSTYGGVVLALQEVIDSRRDAVFAPQLGVLGDATSFAPSLPPPSPRTHSNRYAFAMVGRDVPKANLSLAGSVFWSGLTGIDGVELLYAGSQSIKQFGQALDFRLGMLKQWSGDQSLEAVVVHNRFAMTHDVTYVDFFWDPTTRRSLPMPRFEHNPDRTNTWGLHLQYQQPVGDSGVRIGGILTANRMSHPKIPNYQILSVMSIPRDPGSSSAFNAGIGISQTQGPVTVGLDAIYEPIWSYTWADAASPVQTTSGGTIPAGGKTIENRFHFSNGLLRAGASREFKLEAPGSSARVQLGAQLRSINYHLDQFDNALAAGRGHDESWTEWTFAGGASFRFPEVEVHYRVRTTSGTGRPGVAGGGCCTAVDAGTFATTGSILVAPSGTLTLAPVRVTTHQFSVSLPLR